MHSQALMQKTFTLENPVLKNLILVFGAVSILAILSRLAIPVPGSPVPITGQTFGVAIVSLLWGRKHALASMGAYFALGCAGLPIFSMGAFGFGGPTSGYLLGMLAASYVVGGLADRGFARHWFTAWLSATLGSVLIFSCGLLWLSFFLPREALLAAGLLPFLPGDLIKNATAAWIASRANRIEGTRP